MAAETDYLTLTGILKARAKEEYISAFLREIKAVDPKIGSDIHLAKGLSVALSGVLLKIDKDCHALKAAHPAEAQMNIEELMENTRKTDPTIPVDILEKVEEVVRRASDTGDDPPPVHEPEPEPAVVLSALQEAQPDRGWSLYAMLWAIPIGNRANVITWCEDGASGPAPEGVSRLILEELNPEGDLADLETLLGMVGIHFQDGFNFGELSPELIAEYAAWARAAHQKDRGEDVDVPALPETFLPKIELFTAVMARLQAKEFTLAQLGWYFSLSAAEQPSAELASEALYRADFLAMVEGESEEDLYSAGAGVEGVLDPAFIGALTQIARNIGAREEDHLKDVLWPSITAAAADEDAEGDADDSADEPLDEPQPDDEDKPA